jgi:hypothetical protein
MLEAKQRREIKTKQAECWGNRGGGVWATFHVSDSASTSFNIGCLTISRVRLFRDFSDSSTQRRCLSECSILKKKAEEANLRLALKCFILVKGGM